MAATPQIAIALGGGGARGLAHIIVLEALEELGLKPAVIAGTSMGALVGAACAAGIPASEIRAHALASLGTRKGAFQRIISEAGMGAFTLLNFNPFKVSLVDGEDLLEVFWPDGVPDTFAALEIPFKAVATDFYGRKDRALNSGNLRTAVSASIALPGLIEPKIVAGRVLIDGSISNPLPVDHLPDMGIRIGIDVTGGPVERGRKLPPLSDLLFRSLQITQAAVVEARLETLDIDILIRPAVDHFRVLDFFKVREIFKAAEPSKDELKRALESAVKTAGC